MKNFVNICSMKTYLENLDKYYFMKIFTQTTSKKLFKEIFLEEFSGRTLINNLATKLL